MENRHKRMRILSLAMAMAISVTAGEPVFGDEFSKGEPNVYSVALTDSNTIKSNSGNEEFLFGEKDVVFDFEKAVRIYNEIPLLNEGLNGYSRATVNTDSEVYIVPVKDHYGNFIAYAEFEGDEEQYKLISVSQGDYYTELYNTLECENFKSYVNKSDNVYVYGDPLLNDIGFYIEGSNCTSEFLDYTALYNENTYLTRTPVTSEMLINGSKIHSYLDDKNKPDNDFGNYDHTSSPDTYFCKNP